MSILEQLRASLAPKYTTPSGNPDLTVKGTANYAPSSHPLALINSSPNGSVDYSRVFADVAPDGSPVAYYYPGSFGVLVPAGKGYRG